jgi:hypothetical protein
LSSPLNSNVRLTLCICFSITILPFPLGDLYQTLDTSLILSRGNQFTSENTAIGRNLNITADASVNSFSNFTTLVPYVDNENGIALLYPTDWIVSNAGLSYPLENLDCSIINKISTKCVFARLYKSNTNWTS